MLEEQRRWRDQLEADPIQFLAPERDLEPKLDLVRLEIAKLVHADPQDIVFVRNATDGVNAVVRSLPLEKGDQIVVTDHGYNACTNAVRYVAENMGCEVRIARIPFPIQDCLQVVDAIAQTLTPATRLVLVDHVTSPTGLVFPVEQIVQMIRNYQGRHPVRIMIDGAHGPGMLPLNLQNIGADYYTANHHKWLCGPKVSGFLWVRRELQHEVRPTIISHAANRDRADRSRFIAEFDWTGTFDPTPLLALPKSLEFLGSLYSDGLAGLMAANREKTLISRRILTNTLGIEIPAPDSMIGSLATVPIPADSNVAPQLQRLLRDRHHFELPVFASSTSNGCLIRISIQAYNSLSQVQRLADLLVQSL